MHTEVIRAVEELKRQFPAAVVDAAEDGQGGAFVTIDPVDIGAKYQPAATWLGAQIPAQYPYADIYPVFIGGDVARADGASFAAPITPSNFQGRPALQISRRNNSMQQKPQTAVAKILKVLDFLGKLP